MSILVCSVLCFPSDCAATDDFARVRHQEAEKQAIFSLSTLCCALLQEYGQQKQSVQELHWHGLLRHAPSTCHPAQRAGKSRVVHPVHALPGRDCPGQVRSKSCEAENRKRLPLRSGSALLLSLYHMPVHGRGEQDLCTSAPVGWLYSCFHFCHEKKCDKALAWA
eukprot:1151812-Pelagomonas_calceolata.AAC.6